MATPSPRNSIRIARGLYADLLASIADLGIGELCYGIDHDKFYTPDGQGGLAEVGRGTAIATLEQVGDVDLTGLQNGQVLKWDGSSWSPAEDVAPVTSVAGKVGVVTLVKADITDLDESDYATAAQGALADTALQPGDAFSGDYNDLTNQPTIPAALPDLTDVVSPLLVANGEVLRYRSSNSRFEPGVAVDPAGATMTGTLGTTERTITAGAFDLATGNHWTCGAITVPAPTNATAGTSGLIRITAGPVVWNTVFKFPGATAPTIASFPAIIPFYVQDSSNILMGNVAEGIA